jgi:hypothetical protein
MRWHTFNAVKGTRLLGPDEVRSYRGSVPLSFRGLYQPLLGRNGISGAFSAIQLILRVIVEEYFYSAFSRRCLLGRLPGRGPNRLPSHLLGRLLSRSIRRF